MRLLKVELGHDPPLPHGLEQVVAAHNPITGTNEKLKQVKYLGLDFDEIRPAPQFAPVRVERTIVEQINHRTGSPTRRSNTAEWAVYTTTTNEKTKRSPRVKTVNVASAARCELVRQQTNHAILKMG